MTWNSRRNVAYPAGSFIFPLRLLSFLFLLLMINVRPWRRAILLSSSSSSHPALISPSPRWFSPSPTKNLGHLSFFLRRRRSLEIPITEALKSFPFSLSSGEQIHALAIKSGIFYSNLFVRNGIMNLYAKCQQPISATSIFESGLSVDSASFNIMIGMYAKMDMFSSARELFDEMPKRDCVSFTTMIMALAQRDEPDEALLVFHEMISAGVMPNEVTISSVIAACSRLQWIMAGRSVHGLAIKLAIIVSVLVSTNLVHLYALQPATIHHSEAIFFEMPERSTVTWNAMLNGYAKAGLADAARSLFLRIPSKDLVSWATLIAGYLRIDRLQEAMAMFREMDMGPNEFILVDLISSCSRLFEFEEGRKLHAMILKSGLDSFPVLQATIIHFYGEAGEVDLACSQFESGDKNNVSSWNALMGGFIRNGMLPSARSLFDKMPERDLVSWSTMICGCSKNQLSTMALDLFQDMQANGIEPNEITLLGILSAISLTGDLEEGRRVHELCLSKFSRLSNNLTAALIDMYAKCGSIREALKVFRGVRDSAAGLSISPWNAVICGLAAHGSAEMAIKMFSELEMEKKLEPNSITFLGILSACCHKGLVFEGKHYFERMREKYKIMPTIKHYGCMVDLLGRAGWLEEAAELVSAMPIEPDEVIWGTMLAASRTHGNVEVAEKAAAGLAKLAPQHGPSKLLLSNIYATAGRWEDVTLVRSATQALGLKKRPGCSVV